MPRKRAREEMEADASVSKTDNDQLEISPLSKLRNMWQFACLMQYIYMFGKAVKIDEDIDIEDLEDMCLDPDQASGLAGIGLAMLKFISSHRGLTHELFDEYTRRQYLAKAPLRNPFGEDEDPKRFADFDSSTKIKVLQQLSVWTFGNGERIRSLMPEADTDDTFWRIEPYGWDSEDRTYFVLDDDRLYRRTDAPLPPTPVKSKSKAKPKQTSRSSRSSKRRKTVQSQVESDVDDENIDNTSLIDIEKIEPEMPQDDGFGGMIWECVAVTLEEFQNFMDTLRRSRDANEKALVKQISEHVIPLLEKRAEAHRQKMLKRQREMENLQKMSMAKRSSRIADKMERQRREEEEAAVERKRLEDLKLARREIERQLKREEDRTTRMNTREQRIRERETNRILHQAELQRIEQMEEMDANGVTNGVRHSSRQLQSEKERQQRKVEELEDLGQSDKWFFDCSGCGLHGENIDDGAHSIACERCNIWQHSSCNGISVTDADREDFHFICSDCKRKEEVAKRPKIPTLKLGRLDGSSPAPLQPDVPARPMTPPPELVGLEFNAITTVTPNQNDLSRHFNDNHAGSANHQHSSAIQSSVTPHIPLEHTNTEQTHTADTNGIISPGVHKNLHQNAHASAVASNGLHQSSNNHFPPPLISATTTVEFPHANGLQSHDPRLPPPAAFHPPAFLPPTFLPPYSNYQEQSPSSRLTKDTNGDTTMSDNIDKPPTSPVKSNNAPIPSTIQNPRSPFNAPMLSSPHASPFHDLSPPSKTMQEQKLAGLSPVKHVSPSSHNSFRAPFLSSSSPSKPPPLTATPTTHPPIISSPQASDYLAATPHAVYSPIPPVGDGPVIPQKHDQPVRPPSQDHVGEMSALPPTKLLSPSHVQDGKGMGVQAGEGGLGTGNVPVKKLPPLELSPIPPFEIN